VTSSGILSPESARKQYFTGRKSFFSKLKKSRIKGGNQCSFIIAKLINIDPNIGQYYLNLKKYKRRA
jgi:hypothetical protein